jgi:membrane associated rhomboid family serine protease
MIELYFLFVRIPKMMSLLARERNRSAWKWSLLGIVGWLGGEAVVVIILSIIYGLGSVIYDWPEEPPGVFVLFTYAAAIGGAIGGLTLVRRILSAKPTGGEIMPVPPPPPRFD